MISRAWELTYDSKMLCRYIFLAYISFCHIHPQFYSMISQSQELLHFFNFFKLNTICLSFHTREAHQSPIFSLLVPIPFLGVVHNPTSSKKWGIASDHQCSVDATPGHFCPWACIALSQILTWSLRFLDQVSLQDNLSRILCWVTWYLASLGTHTP